MSKWLKKMKLKEVKGYYTRVQLEKRIAKLNDIRDRYGEDNKLYYPWIMRFIASIYSKYYTKKWERWYD